MLRVSKAILPTVAASALGGAFSLSSARVFAVAEVAPTVARGAVRFAALLADLGSFGIVGSVFLVVT